MKLIPLLLAIALTFSLVPLSHSHNETQESKEDIENFSESEIIKILRTTLYVFADLLVEIADLVRQVADALADGPAIN